MKLKIIMAENTKLTYDVSYAPTALSLILKSISFILLINNVILS